TPVNGFSAVLVLEKQNLVFRHCLEGAGSHSITAIHVHNGTPIHKAGCSPILNPMARAFCRSIHKVRIEGVQRMIGYEALAASGKSSRNNSTSIHTNLKKCGACIPCCNSPSTIHSVRNICFHPITVNGGGCNHIDF